MLLDHSERREVVAQPVESGHNWRAALYAALFCLILLVGAIPSVFGDTTGTIPDLPGEPPVLENPGFECSVGTYLLPAAQGGEMRIPVGWTVNILQGLPWIYSASMDFNHGNCGGDAHVEKIEGDDSLVMFAPDLETPPKPGKPFDAVVHQQAQAIPGVAYSLSAWLLSLCGGSSMPNDCPQGYYMTKMLGIDPTGGTDPLADTVVWTENSQNFVENGQRVGWINLRLVAVAQAETVTVFGRIRSPFQWHGNHAFIDAFSLVRAPVAHIDDLPDQVAVNLVEVQWHGRQSPEIEAIPAGLYRLIFDLEYRVGDSGEWVPWKTGQAEGSDLFMARAANEPHYLRVRARSEQPPPPPAGAWPNHRYPGLWSDPIAVTFSQEPFQHQVFAPFVQK